MINNVVLVGRLTKDPELTYTPSGVAKARFTIAVNRSFSNQQGEREADFISCIAWRAQAQNLANFMRKGGLIGVQGRIQTGSYEGQDGKRVYTTDIVADSIQFLESKNAGGGRDSYQPQQNQPSYGGGQPDYMNAAPANNYGNRAPEPGFNNYQQNQPPMNQQNHTRVDADPFANSKGQVDVSEDDLPF